MKKLKKLIVLLLVLTTICALTPVTSLAAATDDDSVAELSESTDTKESQNNQIVYSDNGEETYSFPANQYLTGEGFTDQYGGISTITGAGTYYIDKDSIGLITIDTSEPVMIIGVTQEQSSSYGLSAYGDDVKGENNATEGASYATRLAFKYGDSVDSADLSLDNVCISLTDAVPNNNEMTTSYGTSYYKNTDYRDMFDFTNCTNINVTFFNTNMLDMDTNANYHCLFHVTEGQTAYFHDGGSYGGETSINYLYSREQGAGIGGRGGGDKACGTIIFGDDGCVGPMVFMKNSKQGAGIGNGANTSAQPGDITFKSGIYNFIAVSRAAMISGSAGSSSEAAGNVYIYPNVSMRTNVDFTGAAIGGGGYASGNDKGGGNAYFYGGSVAVFEDYNSSGNNEDGSGFTGYSDTMITATKLNTVEEKKVTYPLIFNTEDLASTSYSTKEFKGLGYDKWDTSTSGWVTVKPSEDYQAPSFKYFNVTNAKTGSQLYVGPEHAYFYVNETKYKTEQNEITTTFTNWKLHSMQETPASNPYLYFFLTGEDQTLLFKGNGGEEEVSFKFTHGDTFTHYDSDGKETTKKVSEGDVFGASDIDSETNIDYGTFDRWDTYAWVKVVDNVQTVTGGSLVTEGGEYQIEGSQDGIITVNATDKVVLDGQGEEFSNLKLNILGTGIVVLKNVKFTGTDTLLDIDESCTIKLEGTSSFKSTGADTVSVAAGKTVTIDSNADAVGEIHQTSGVLEAKAKTGYAAIRVGEGATFIQAGGTIKAEKTCAEATKSADGKTTTGSDDAAGAAVEASSATIKFTGGEFAGTTNGAIPVIKASAFNVASIYATIFAASPYNKYAIEADSYQIAGGSIKIKTNISDASDNSDGTNPAGIKNIEDSNYAPIKLDTTKLNHTATTFTLWDGDATQSSNRICYSSGHFFNASADGKSLEATANSVCDPYLYVWLSTAKSNHTIKMNDDAQGTFSWDADDKIWSTSEVKYTVSIKEGQEAFWKLKVGTGEEASSVECTAGTTITATLTYNKNNYSLNTSGARIYSQLGQSTQSSGLNIKSSTTKTDGTVINVYEYTIASKNYYVGAELQEIGHTHVYGDWTQSGDTYTRSCTVDGCTQTESFTVDLRGAEGEALTGVTVDGTNLKFAVGSLGADEIVYANGEVLTADNGIYTVPLTAVKADGVATRLVGDANGNGKVDSSDAGQMLLAASGAVTFSGANGAAANEVRGASFSERALTVLEWMTSTITTIR